MYFFPLKARFIPKFIFPKKFLNLFLNLYFIKIKTFLAVVRNFNNNYNFHISKYTFSFFY